MHVRIATAEDYSSIEGLLRELNALHSEIEPELIRRVEIYLGNDQYLQILKDEKQEILLLEDAGTVIGCAWIAERMHEGGQAIEMPVAFIYEICIKESCRREGFGRTLIRAIENWALDRKLGILEFNVWSRNQAALQFYEELGFRYVRHEMSKTLAQQNADPGST